MNPARSWLLESAKCNESSSKTPAIKCAVGEEISRSIIGLKFANSAAANCRPTSANVFPLKNENGAFRCNLPQKRKRLRET
ncbi:MAG: hypothetical protein B9S37_09650 [Verrucomicrobiia bacterium Tous-C3TDCM]|nr:MAG: hypothetical protein B9S37_09650 [Verrucomicrobiae bacterium Tous-C3TDCM]